MFATSAIAHNTPVTANESGCACAFRSHAHSYACRVMRACSSLYTSGVMHAYVKERAREGMGTAVPARARLHPRNARTGTHGTGCACRCFLAGRTSTLCSVDTSALVVDCGIFRKLPCLQTRYIVERAADASLTAEIDPAQPAASVSSANPRAKTQLIPGSTTWS
jgi:hypothetical protein